MTRIKRTIAISMIACVFVLTVTGCSNQIPDMTEEQNALITEYAAGLLLKYHADYEGKLVDTSVPPQLPPVVEMPVEEIVSDNSIEEGMAESDLSTLPEEVEQVEKPTLTIAQVLGTDGFDIKYRSYEVCDRYPSTDAEEGELFFSMKAGPGNKLLVLKLDITNTSGQEAVFDTLSMTDLNCKIIINGTDTQRAYVSMLENDFLAINRTFIGAETYEAAIITEMPEDKAMAVTTAELQLKNGGREAKVSAIE